MIPTNVMFGTPKTKNRDCFRPFFLWWFPSTFFVAIFSSFLQQLEEETLTNTLKN